MIMKEPSFGLQILSFITKIEVPCNLQNDLILLKRGSWIGFTFETFNT